ncbi:MAG: DUF1361 domain-containing protein [Myxococcota bacterium]
MNARFWAVPVCGSALVLVGLVAREVVGQTWPWLAFNLLLAWIPLLLGAVASRHPGLLVALGLPWLLFLPNAPYLLTDLCHLKARAPVPLWFDTALLGGTGALGIAIGVASLHQVVGAVHAWFGRWPAVAVWFGAPIASGFGMYLGRFLRWNSWNVVTRPYELVADIADILLHPAAHVDAWAYTATFGGLFLVAALGPRPAPVVSSAT